MAVLLLQNMIVVFSGLTGGEIGLTVPDVISIDADTNYWLALGFMAVSGLILTAIARSPVGLILQAAGQDPVVTGALGFNVAKHKLAAFAVSAAFSGLAGGLVVFYMGTASVGTLVDTAVGVQVIIAAVLGGRRTIVGGGARRRVPDRGGRVAAAAGHPLDLRGLGGGPPRHPVRAVGASGPRILPESAMTVAVRPAPPQAAAPIPVTAEPCLTVRGLTKRFGGLVAVKDIDLDLRPGEILGLIGPNGSGKSTVMKLIMGLERPSAGSIRLDGAEIGGLPAHRVARSGIGLVFQHARPLQRQTVLEKHQPRASARQPDPARRRSPRGAAGPGDRRARRPRRGGRPAARHPAVRGSAPARTRQGHRPGSPGWCWSTSPSPASRAARVAAFSELIRGFRDEGKAVLLVDHNVKSVAALVDRVFAMYLGERIAEGSAESVMADPTVRRVYLGGSIETAARPEAAFKPDSLLTVEGVDVLYGKAQALRGASIHVHEGEFVSVVGLNGAGKTTLFNAISGLVPHTGTIRFDGRDLTRMKPAAIARAGIVQVPETRELFGDLNVRENLDLGGQHFPKAESARQRDGLYELFPILKAREGQSARTLSGGEQQMLTIARALMMRPRLLILDEPTLGLAPVILELLSKALERLRQTTPITVLLGEQNVTFALPHADRVYVLEQARIVWEGPPQRFASEMGSAYL